MMKNLLRNVLVSLVVRSLILSIAVVVLAGCVPKEQEGPKKEKAAKQKEPAAELILATTTSTKDSGLLDEIVPIFEKKYNVKVKIIAVGTGEALAMGERGEADVLLVHARKSEDEFMAKGYGSVRKDVMYNDFVILGPEDDPAGIKGMQSAADAFKKVSKKRTTFITRGDDSGTHKKEMKIWEKAGVTPEGDWYQSTGQGMGASLQIANEKRAYILCDRATYLSQKKNLKLSIMVEREAILFNPYGVIGVNPEKFPKVHAKEAMEFIDWLTSVETQKIIG